MKAQKVQQHLGENILCQLCQHYLIDAVTILDCLHSFCRSCLLKHLQEKKACPVCNVEFGAKISKAIKRDDFLQKLVYKLVPEMYWSELKQRTEYLRKRTVPEEEVAFILDNKITDLANHLCAPHEKVPLCLEYVRSAPTQEEADEDFMDWQNQIPGEGPSAAAVEPDQPSSSGLCSNEIDKDEVESLNSNKVPKKTADEGNRMEIDNSKESKKAANVHLVNKITEEKPCSVKCDKPICGRLPPPEFRRYFLTPAKTKISTLRKLLEGKLKVRENGVQLLFLDVAKNAVLENECTIQDVAYMFGWDRRESLKILFTLQREPADDEPPVLIMEEMPVLFAEEPVTYQEDDAQEQSPPVIPPVTIPQLTVTLDAAAMEGSGKQQPIIVTGPTQPPRKRRKVSSPTKRTSRTPPYLAVQRMTGLSPHEKAPPLAPPPTKEPLPGKRNLLNPAALNGSVMATGAGLPTATTGTKKNLKPESKSSSADEKQEHLNSRIHEILLHKGLPAPPPVITVSSTSSDTSSDAPGTSRTTSCISTTPRAIVPNLTTAIRTAPSTTSCIVPTSPMTQVSQLRCLQPRHEKTNYEDFVRRFITVPRFFAPGASPPLLFDPRIAHAPIKSILSVPQTDVAPYLRPPPPNPYPNIIQHLGLKRKQ